MQLGTVKIPGRNRPPVLLLVVVNSRQNIALKFQGETDRLCYLVHFLGIKSCNDGADLVGGHCLKMVAVYGAIPGHPL